jgi:hypothetical protein
MMSGHKHYLTLFSLLVTGLLLAVVTTNVIVDPFGLFRQVRIKGFNAQKTQQMKLGGRNVKAYAIIEGKFDAIILGSSRAQTGIDPHHPVFGRSSTYNAALPETNLYELEKVFRLVKSRRQAKILVIGLDFLLFTDSRRTAGDFEQSTLAGRSVARSRYSSLLSLDTFKYSLFTVADNIKGRKSRFSDLGFKKRAADLSRTGGHRAMFDDVLKGKFMNDTGIYSTYVYSSQRVNLLTSILAACRHAGIQVYSFISPVHATQLEAIRAMGLYEVYEQWERDLARVYSDHNRAHPDEQAYRLLDFSGYNDWTTEPIPDDEHPLQKMHWYWESSHYKKELGNLVLKAIFDPGSDTAFSGYEITDNDIEQHLAALRRQRDAYAVEHGPEIERVERLMHDARNGSRLYNPTDIEKGP